MACTLAASSRSVTVPSILDQVLSAQSASVSASTKKQRNGSRRLPTAKSRSPSAAGSTPRRYRRAIQHSAGAARRRGRHAYRKAGRQRIRRRQPRAAAAGRRRHAGRWAVRTPTALILRSRTERLRFLNAVHRDLAGTAFLAVLAATLVSYAVARTVTRPLGAITATMREMASTGDLTQEDRAVAGRRAGTTRMRGCWRARSTR